MVFPRANQTDITEMRGLDDLRRYLLSRLAQTGSILLLGCLSLLSFLASAAPALRYDVTYNGILSAMQPLDIADAVFSVKPIPLDGLRLGRVDVSSAGHGLMESLYPFRYRIRSLYRENGEGSVAFEFSKKTSRIRQKVFCANPAKGKLLTYRTNGSGPELPALVAHQFSLARTDFRQKGEGMSLPAGELFDYLSMLEQVSAFPLKTGREYSLNATDGDETFEYRVRVEGQVLQQAAGRSWNTWKLQLTAIDREGEPAHKPIDIWIADDRQTLVKAEARHTLGLFTVSLVETDAQEMTEAEQPWLPPPRQQFMTPEQGSS